MSIAERVYKAIKPCPMCRDRADNNGRCPNTGELCDPVLRAQELFEEVSKLESGRSSLMFKNYRKKNLQPMRPYVPGEDMTGISVSPEDTPEEGGMIAVNPLNGKDRWYVAKDLFEANYELVE